MRALALSLTLVGLITLLFIFFSTPREVNSLNDVRVKEVVRITGVISKESISSAGHTFIIGNVSFRCSCPSVLYEGHIADVVGYVDEFNGKKYVQILKLKIT